MWVDDRGDAAAPRSQVLRQHASTASPPDTSAAHTAARAPAAPGMNGRGSGSLPPEPDGRAPVPTEPSLDALTCPLCLELFEVPCVLGCGHAVCRGCVLALGGEGAGLLCPTCKTPSGPVDPSQLPVAAGIEKALADLHSHVKAAPPQTCDKCEEAVATLACDICNLLLCAACNDEHHKGKFKTHAITDASTFSATMVPFCRRTGHTRYKTDLLCVESGELVCLLCFQIDKELKNKTCIPVGEAVSTTKEEVVEWMERAEMCKSDMKTNVVQVDKMVGGIRDGYTEDLHRVRSEFRALRSELEARELQVIEGLAKHKDKQVRALSDMRTRIASGIAAMNVEIVRAEHAVRSGTVTDLFQFLEKNKGLLGRMDANGANAKLPPCIRPAVRFNKAAAGGVRSFVHVELDNGVMDTPRNSLHSSAESPRSVTTPSPLSSSNPPRIRADTAVRLSNSLYTRTHSHHQPTRSRDLHSEESDTAFPANGAVPSHRRSTTASREGTVTRVAQRAKQTGTASAHLRSKSRGQSPGAPRGAHVGTNGGHAGRNGFSSPQRRKDRSPSPPAAFKDKDLILQNSSPTDAAREAYAAGTHAYAQPAVYTRQFQQRQEAKIKKDAMELREGWKR